MLCGVGCGWSFPLILICLIGAGLSNDTPQIEKVGTMTRSGVLIQNESWIFDSIIFSGWSNAVHYVWIPRPGAWMPSSITDPRMKSTIACFCYKFEISVAVCIDHTKTRGFPYCWPSSIFSRPFLSFLCTLFKRIGSPYINLSQSIDNSQLILVNHSDS